MCFKELAKVSRHCLEVVRHENSAGVGSDRQDVRISNPGESPRVRG
jgi:hypothetical protein